MSKIRSCHLSFVCDLLNESRVGDPGAPLRTGFVGERTPTRLSFSSVSHTPLKLRPKRSPISSGRFSLLCLKFKRWFLPRHLLLLYLTGHLFRSSTVERPTSAVSFFSGQRVRAQYRVTRSYCIARV